VIVEAIADVNPNGLDLPVKPEMSRLPSVLISADRFHGMARRSRGGFAGLSLCQIGDPGIKIGFTRDGIPGFQQAADAVRNRPMDQRSSTQ
jgi:hypothetical protein